MRPQQNGAFRLRTAVTRGCFMQSFWPRINTVLLLVTLLTVIGVFATRAYGGPLDPPGTPAPTPGGIDGRIPIDHLPFEIAEPGSYVVTRDLLSAGGNGITVSADDVTIDLNGFTLAGTGQVTFGGGFGIAAAERSNLTVVNGVIRGWNRGIDNPSITGGKTGLFRHLLITSNGFGVLPAPGSRFDGNIVRDSAYNGVESTGRTTIMNSTFVDNSTAIRADVGQDLIEGNHIEIPAGGTGIYASDFTTVRRNYFANPALTGYTTIDLNTATYVVIIENRMKASLTTGAGGVGLYLPYDTANALTNISP